MRRLDRVTKVLLILAGLWALAQLVLAYFVHVTERARCTPSGCVVPHTKTYIQAFAVSEVVLTLVVLGVVALVTALFRLRMRHGEFGAGALAWALSVATLIFGVVGFRYLFGVGVLLCVACASVRRHPLADEPGLTTVSGAALS